MWARIHLRRTICKMGQIAKMLELNRLMFHLFRKSRSKITSLFYELVILEPVAQGCEGKLPNVIYVYARLKVLVVAQANLIFGYRLRILSFR